MRELKATKINAADFAPFGTFFSMTEPEGYPLQGEIHKFYPFVSRQTIERVCKRLTWKHIE